MTDEPVVRVQRRRFSPIWIVPIIAAAIAAWLGWRTLGERGEGITITFESAEGLEAGRTRVLHKNVQVGTVDSVDLSKDLSHVVVRARISHNLESHLAAGTRFWVVRPRLSVGGVSGLSTLVSGAYIEMAPGPGKRVSEFKGLEDPPVLPSTAPGKSFTLVAARLGSLTQGSPVYYRGIAVGEVSGYSLGKDAGHVSVIIFVRAPYDVLVHPETRFWNASGFQISTGADGLKASTESLQSLLVGGVAFDTRTESASADPSPKDATFRLYVDEESARTTPYGTQVYYRVHFRGSVRGLDVGAPVYLQGIRVGRVTDVHLELGTDETSIRIPITLALEPERGVLAEGQLSSSAEELQRRTNEHLSKLVGKGLRAELKTGNLLTGQRVVSLLMLPNSPPAKLGFGAPYPELPSVPAADIDSITESASGLVAELRQLVGGPEMKRTIANLEKLTREASSGIGPVLNSLKSASAQMEQTLSAASEVLGGTDGSGGELPKAIRDMRDAARSVRLLTDYLEQHPEALIRGKQEAR